MGTISKEYSKKMPDGTNCKFTFTIEADNMSVNAQEILHNLAILSKSAYIHLGNKMVYGSEDQNEIGLLAANKVASMKTDNTPDTLKICQHYGMAKDYEAVKQGAYKAVDFLVGKEEDIKELTADMAGFGTDNSQRVIIDYDKSYGWFVAKRIPMDYGTFDNAPLKTD